MIYKVWGGDGRTTLEGLVSGITGKSGSSGKSGMDWKMSEKDCPACFSTKVSSRTLLICQMKPY